MVPDTQLNKALIASDSMKKKIQGLCQYDVYRMFTRRLARSDQLDIGVVTLVIRSLKIRLHYLPHELSRLTGPNH